MTYLSPSQVGTWSGWNEPIPPPSSFPQMRRDLIDAIARELADVPIQQQTVIVATLWDMDTWGVEILTEAPRDGRYDGFAECLVDFDPYHGSIECLRQSTAKALADNLMEAAFPHWRNIQEFGPHWEADPLDWN